MKRPFVVITMKLTIIVLISFVLVFCGGGGGGGGPLYSNATLTGTWMGKLIFSSSDSILTSFKFDGNGHMVEFYDVNPGTLPYPYNVQANGSFTINVGNPPAAAVGMLTSATTGVITSYDGSPVTGYLKKVMDLSACQGTWNGTLAVAFTNSFQITVDSTGTITSGSGFAPPYGGKLFCESGEATGLITTGDSWPLDRMAYHSGTVVSGATVTIIGNYETNSGNGTYTLVKGTIDNSRISGMFTLAVVDASGGAPATDYGTMSFDGAGNGSFTSLVSVNSSTFKYTMTVPDNTITIDNTTIGTLNNSGSFFAAIGLDSGVKGMLIGIKQASLFTDTTATFIGGIFEVTPSSIMNTVLFTTHASDPGVLLYTNLTSSSTGTLDYTIASNGTFTVNPASPDTYGAISADKNVFMFSQVGSKQAIAIAIKYPNSGMTNTSLNGTYKAYEFWNDTGTFGATRYSLAFYGNGAGTYTVLQDSGGLTGSGTFTYSVASDGTFMIDGGAMKGAVLQDGSMIVFDDDDPADSLISAAVGIKQ